MRTSETCFKAYGEKNKQHNKQLERARQEKWQESQAEAIHVGPGRPHQECALSSMSSGKPLQSFKQESDMI